jgi:hypothetical protein
MKTTEKLKLMERIIINRIMNIKDKIYNKINIKILLFLSIALNIFFYLYIIEILSVINCYHALVIKLIK